MQKYYIVLQLETEGINTLYKINFRKGNRNIDTKNNA